MNLLKIPSDHLNVPRFDKTERLLHWLNSAFYLLPMLSGFGMSYPLFRFLCFGHPKIILVCHVFAGLALSLAMLYLYFFKKTRIPLWAWRRHFAYLSGNKYNAGQKINITVSALAFTVFLVSGIMLVMVKVLPVPLVKAAYCAHNWALLLILPVIVGHIFLALIHPATNPSLYAMLVGKVEERYARRHHPKWLDAIFGTSETGGRK